MAEKCSTHSEKCSDLDGKMQRWRRKYAAIQTEKCSASMDTRRIKQFPLLTTKNRSFPHTLNERIVYSYLAYQDRISQSASIRKIAAETGLDGRSVAKALVTLGPLVSKLGNRWVAVQPSGDCAGWFAPRSDKKNERTTENEKHWSESLASMKLLLPRKKALIEGSRFTANHAAVYSLLVSLAGKDTCVEGTSAAHLAKMLSGMDVQTVSRSLGLMEHVGLVHVFVDGVRLNVQVTPLSDDHLILFAAADQKVEAIKKEDEPEWIRPSHRNPLHDHIYEYCVRHGIPGPLAQEITKTASRIWGIDFQLFSLILDQAYVEHRANRMKGKFNSPHCGNLVRFKLNERIKLQPAAYGVTDHESAPKEEDSPPQRKPRTAEEELAHRESVSANPLHPDRREFTALDITKRVGIERAKAHGVLEDLSRFLSKQHEQTHGDFMAACDFGLEMTPKIVGHSLQALNHYYQQDRKATLDELHDAINAALQACELKPMFERPPSASPELDDKLDEAWIERLLSESAMEGPITPVCETGDEVSTSPDSTVKDPLDELR